MPNPLLESTQKGRYALPMAVIVNSNGVDVPRSAPDSTGFTASMTTFAARPASTDTPHQTRP
jgi:hypothetical protein